MHKKVKITTSDIVSNAVLSNAVLSDIVPSWTYCKHWPYSSVQYVIPHSDIVNKGRSGWTKCSGLQSERKIHFLNPWQTYPRWCMVCPPLMLKYCKTCCTVEVSIWRPGVTTYLVPFFPVLNCIPVQLQTLQRMFMSRVFNIQSI